MMPCPFSAPPVSPPVRCLARPCAAAAAGLALAALLAAGPAAAQGVVPAMLPHDLSPLGMFRQADAVVRGVMLLLLAASVTGWTILLVKSFELAAASSALAVTRRKIGAADSLAAAVAAVEGRADPASHMLRLAQFETIRAQGPGLAERIDSQLAGAVARGARQAAMGTGVLASIGAVAPFVGLFGTVWGIMNSFIGISQAQTTNLAVVAPGIAEALLATALGLIAAIPAVVIYNLFARLVAGYRLRLADAGAAVQRLASRDRDRAAAAAPAQERA